MSELFEPVPEIKDSILHHSEWATLRELADAALEKFDIDGYAALNEQAGEARRSMVRSILKERKEEDA